MVWVTVSEEAVRRAFKWAARTRLEKFNIAKSSKKALQSLLNKFRLHEPTLKYQMRAGKNDIRLMMKNIERNNIQFWRDVPINYLDPTYNLPNLDLETPPNPEDIVVEEDDEDNVDDSSEGTNMPPEDWNINHKGRYSSPL